MKIKDGPVLKPCPFCHRQPKLSRPERGRAMIECSCGASLELPPSLREHLAEIALIGRWNSR